MKLFVYEVLDNERKIHEAFSTIWEMPAFRGDENVVNILNSGYATDPMTNRR